MAGHSFVQELVQRHPVGLCSDPHQQSLSAIMHAAIIKAPPSLASPLSPSATHVEMKCDKAVHTQFHQFLSVIAMTLLLSCLGRITAVFGAIMEHDAAML